MEKLICCAFITTVNNIAGLYPFTSAGISYTFFVITKIETLVTVYDMHYTTLNATLQLDSQIYQSFKCTGLYIDLYKRVGDTFD